MSGFQALTLVRRHEAAEDAVELTLAVPASSRETFQGAPGQHVVVRAHLDGEEQRRTYSVVSSLGEPLLRLGVRVHERGRVSQHLARELRVGATVDVMPPSGGFRARLDATRPRRHVLIGAGCGVTPLLAIARAILQGEPAAHVAFFLGNRTTARGMYLEELLELKDRFVDRLALHFVMSREPQDVDLFNGWLDPDRVRRFATSLFQASDVDEYYLSLPGDSNDTVTRTLIDLGAVRERIHAERFTRNEMPASPKSPASLTSSSEVDADLKTNVVVIADGRRRTFPVTRGQATLLEAAQSAGIELPFSCRAGVCSTCRAKLRRGEVEMVQNYALEEDEVAAGYVLVCQSRPLSADIELDYDEK